MLKLPLLTYAGYYIFVSSSRTANHKTSQDYVLLGQEKETLDNDMLKLLMAAWPFVNLLSHLKYLTFASLKDMNMQFSSIVEVLVSQIYQSKVSTCLFNLWFCMS